MTALLKARLLLGLLVIILLALQWRLWTGEGSLRHVASLENRVEKLEAENRTLRERNALMAADVQDLKSGLDQIEEIARRDLGMIREGETFIMVVDDEDSVETELSGENP